MAAFDPSIHWVKGIEPCRLALMPRPRGGEWLADEIASLRAVGIHSIVSLLEPGEVRDLELEAEPDLCRSSHIAFRSFPIPDRGVPSNAKALRVLVKELEADVRDGKAVAIHCRAGIGRTGIVAACVLHAIGVPSGEIFPLLGRSRGLAVPDTPEQQAWVERFLLVP